MISALSEQIEALSTPAYVRHVQDKKVLHGIPIAKKLIKYSKTMQNK